MYDLITNGFLTSLIQSFYEAAIFKVHKLLGVRMLRGHVVLDFWPWIVQGIVDGTGKFIDAVAGFLGVLMMQGF